MLRRYSRIELVSFAKRAQNRLYFVRSRKEDLLRQAGLGTIDWSYEELAGLRNEMLTVLYLERIAIDQRNYYQNQLNILSRG